MQQYAVYNWNEEAQEWDLWDIYTWETLVQDLPALLQDYTLKIVSI